MEIYDYSLADNTVTLIDSGPYGEPIYCELEYTFETYTDHEWYSPDGYHEMEIPYLEFEEVKIGSVKMYDETGTRVSWGIDSNEAEELILDLLRENREKLEAWLVEDY